MDSAKTNSVLAREADGTLQITITIPQADVASVEQEVLEELAKTTNVPGFRPGHAPLEEVKKRTSAQTVLERILGKILPEAYKQAIDEHKIVPFLSPKFELINVQTANDWQVRAVTCEAPKVELGDYKVELESV